MTKSLALGPHQPSQCPNFATPRVTIRQLKDATESEGIGDLAVDKPYLNRISGVFKLLLLQRQRKSVSISLLFRF
jgi:hypothetical protein